MKCLDIDGVSLRVWDIGGQETLRKYWSNYYSNTHALIYVVDSADEDRLLEAGNELEVLMKDSDLAQVPLLVFANKQDLMHALDPSEIQEQLKLDNINDRKWGIFACSALKNEGLKEGFEWIVQNMRSN